MGGSLSELTTFGVSQKSRYFIYLFILCVCVGGGGHCKNWG